MDGVEAFELAEALQPNVNPLDVVPPKATGLEILSRLRTKTPATKVLISSKPFGQ